MNPREFDDEEISELNVYIVNQVPQSMLTQVVILDEQPLKKARIFVTTYRIVTACYDYVAKAETKSKVGKYLGEVKMIYNRLYPVLTQRETSESDFSKSVLDVEIGLIINEFKHLINNFINVFIVLAEKQELVDTNKLVGIDLQSKQGESMYDDLTKLVD